MIGCMYRTAVRIKEFGERHNLPALIGLGLWIKDRITKYPVEYF
jgi:hypothetical protein